MEVLEFGIKRENEIQVAGGCAIILDPSTQKYAVLKQTNNGLYRLPSGGVNEGEDIQEGVLREVREESGLHDFEYVEKIAEAVVHYYNSLKNSNRAGRATCFLVILKSTDLVPLHLEEHEKFALEWHTAEEILADWHSRNENKDVDHWIYFFNKSIERVKELGYDKNKEKS